MGLIKNNNKAILEQNDLTKQASFPKLFEGALPNLGLSYIKGCSQYHLIDSIDIRSFVPVYNCTKPWFQSKFNLLPLDQKETFLNLYPGAISLDDSINKNYLDNKSVVALGSGDKIPLRNVHPEYVCRSYYAIEDVALLENVIDSKELVNIDNSLEPPVLIIDCYVGFNDAGYLPSAKDE